jgi:hypothetical protein
VIENDSHRKDKPDDDLCSVDESSSVLDTGFDLAYFAIPSQSNNSSTFDEDRGQPRWLDMGKPDW